MCLFHEYDPVFDYIGGGSQQEVAITWTNPTSSLYRYTVVRIEPSGSPAGVSPIAGGPVFAGAGTSAVAASLLTGQTYTVVAYTVDKYGNVSAPVESSGTF